jgi:hypothetical protein
VLPNIPCQSSQHTCHDLIVCSLTQTLSPQGDGIRRRGLWEMMKSRVIVSRLMKRLETLPINTKQGHRKAVLQGNSLKYASTFILASRTVLLARSHPVHLVSLLQSSRQRQYRNRTQRPDHRILLLAEAHRTFDRSHPSSLVALRSILYAVVSPRVHHTVA